MPHKTRSLPFSRCLFWSPSSALFLIRSLLTTRLFVVGFVIDRWFSSLLSVSVSREFEYTRNDGSSLRPNHTIKFFIREVQTGPGKSAIFVAKIGKLIGENVLNRKGESSRIECECFSVKLHFWESKFRRNKVCIFFFTFFHFCLANGFCSGGLFTHGINQSNPPGFNPCVWVSVRLYVCRSHFAADLDNTSSAALISKEKEA